MKKFALLFFGVLLSLVLVTCAWSDVDIQEGSWEIVIEPDSAGDNSENKPNVFSCCLSQSQLIPVDPSQGKRCEYSDTEYDGQQVVFTRTCKDKKGKLLETRIEMIFNGNTMEGYLHTIIEDPDGGVSDLTEYMTGELKGPCPASN
ncbi:DUF3617 domain-containing protein [Desulfobacter sp.]|uniref:DUF3617 domain-containing protein n=1 Tax=Desulfobacter sp. TaxID=2294 RepID=UPI003D0A7F82